MDTPTQMLRHHVGLEDASLEAGLPQLQAGGTNLAVMVMWPPKEADWEKTVEKLHAVIIAQDARLDAVELARSPSDARRIVAEGHIAMLISMEGAHGIDQSGLPGLARLQAGGLSMLGLTWSFSNRFAGSSGDQGGGLSDAGRALVAEANRLGVMIDVSHASRTTTLEACKISKAPVLASHSDALEVQHNARNLSDAEIQCIAAAGGVIGINLHRSFLGGAADIARIVEHIDHLRAIGGSGVLALGSDYDGLIKTPAELPGAGSLGKIWQALAEHGYTDDEIKGMQGENFMRYWEKVLSLAEH